MYVQQYSNSSTIIAQLILKECSLPVTTIITLIILPEGYFNQKKEMRDKRGYLRCKVIPTINTFKHSIKEYFSESTGGEGSRGL